MSINSSLQVPLPSVISPHTNAAPDKLPRDQSVIAQLSTGPHKTCVLATYYKAMPQLLLMSAKAVGHNISYIRLMTISLTLSISNASTVRPLYPVMVSAMERTLYIASSVASATASNTPLIDSFSTVSTLTEEGL